MRGLGLAVLIGLGISSVAANAADFTPPPRKSGLWKQSISSARAGKPAQAIGSTICMDPSVDKALSVFGSGMGKQTCSSNTINKTATGYSFASVCQMGQAGTISSQGTASGDFSKAYKVSMNSTTTGAAMAAMNGVSTTTITATWEGPCPAGQKPGDMMMSNGMQLNLMGLVGAARK